MVLGLAHRTVKLVWLRERITSKSRSGEILSSSRQELRKFRCTPTVGWLLAHFCFLFLEARVCHWCTVLIACFSILFRTDHTRFYSLALSEDHLLPKPSVIIKYSWVWGVVFRSYVVVVPAVSWRPLFSAHPRSPSLASTLLPSYYSTVLLNIKLFYAAFHRIV